MRRFLLEQKVIHRFGNFFNTKDPLIRRLDDQLLNDNVFEFLIQLPTWRQIISKTILKFIYRSYDCWTIWYSSVFLVLFNLKLYQFNNLSVIVMLNLIIFGNICQNLNIFLITWQCNAQFKHLVANEWSFIHWIVVYVYKYVVGPVCQI